MTSCKDKWVRKFFITETSLHKTGFTIYKVTSLVFLKNSPDTASSVSVWKRYSDFKSLHKSIHTIYKNSSIKEPFPKFAKSKYFGRFEKKVVDERRESANKLLEFIAKHSILYTDDIFIKFFETSLDSSKSNDSNNTGLCNYSTSSDSLDDDHEYRKSETGTINQISISNSERNHREDCHHQVLRTTDDNNIIVTSINASNDMNIKLNATIISFGLNNILDECYSNLDKYEIALTPNNTQALNKTIKDFNHYVIIAAAHINAGHKHEHLEEYKEAYVQYKLGIMQLQHCINIDPDIDRKKRILEKVTKYVKKIDEIYKKYLSYDISMFVKPIAELKKYKIIKILGSSTILVRDTEENVEKVVKTIAKPGNCTRGINNYILCAKVPLVVQLHAFIETESTIFFINEYVNAHKMWQIITSRGKINLRSKNKIRENHVTNMNTYDCEHKMAHSDSLIRIDSDNVKEQIQKNDSSLLNDIDDRSQDLSITQLLDKAKKLLISVDVTLKQSDSIASKLDRYSEHLNNFHVDKISNNSEKNIEFVNLSSAHNLVDNICITRVNIFDNLESENNQALSFEDVTDYIDDPYVNEANEIIESCNNELRLEHWWIPEKLIKRWAAQLLYVLEVSHEQNIVLMNLTPDNILIDQENNIRLNCVIPKQTHEFVDFRIPYTAPELYMYISPISVHPSADVWSFGMIVYELLTGIKFTDDDAYLFYSQFSAIDIPCQVSENARSLITSILKLKPDERPSITELKKHPFFKTPD